MVPSIEEGRIVLIANPVSKSGRGAVAASEAARLLRERVGDGRFGMLTTASAGHGESLARELGPDVGCVIALGGDGLVNEVVNGLMARAPQDRPVLAVIPVGSGNDYAETLGMAYSVPTAVTEILRSTTKRCGPTWDASTAATSPRRSPSVWTPLSRLTPHGPSPEVRPRPAPCSIWKVPSISCSTTCRCFTSKMDVLGAEPGCAPHPEWDDAYLVAVQVGPTYGGHFRITPKARLDDGLLDICWATPELSPMRALALLLRARGGKHAGSDHIHFRRASSLVLDFEEEPPVQIDGEPPLRHALRSSTASPTPLRPLWASGRTMKKPRGGGACALEMVPSTGFEPAAPCSGGKCSIP